MPKSQYVDADAVRLQPLVTGAALARAGGAEPDQRQDHDDHDDHDADDRGQRLTVS